jgi:hypothetical protein
MFSYIELLLLCVVGFVERSQRFAVSLHAIRNVVVTDRGIGSFALYLSQRHPHCASQRQDGSDYDYSKGYKLDQIIWPFSVGISISEETTSACASRCRRFHVCNTPFTAEVRVDSSKSEIAVFMSVCRQPFGCDRCTAKVTLLSLSQMHTVTAHFSSFITCVFVPILPARNGVLLSSF